LEIIQPNLFIVVVTTISEGVDCCNLASRGINLNLRYTPSIVGISCNRLSILVNDADYVALQVLDEVVGNNRVVEIILAERDGIQPIRAYNGLLYKVKSVFCL
jgi:hypothetical protein